MQMSASVLKSRIKVGSTVAISGAIALYIWLAFAPLPDWLNPLVSIVGVVLVIHAVEGAIASVLILRSRLLVDKPLLNEPISDKPSSEPQSLLLQHLPNNTLLAVLKAGLYTFFVGTVGLQEIIAATRQQSV
jgi:hypothetical protein